MESRFRCQQRYSILQGPDYQALSPTKYLPIRKHYPPLLVIYSPPHLNRRINLMILLEAF